MHLRRALVSILATLTLTAGRSIETTIAAQNDARRQSHADAEAYRNRLLDSEMRTPTDRPQTCTLSRAQAELQRLGADTGCEPALGPVLLGGAALLREQSQSQQCCCCWVLERSALLNCGDDVMRRVVRLFMSDLGFTNAASRVDDKESATRIGEQHSSGFCAFAVSDGQWSPSEMRTLASLVTRLAARQPIGRQPAGRVQMTRWSWTPRTYDTWHARVLAAANAWCVRWLRFRGLLGC